MSPSRCSTTPCSASSPYSGTCTSVFTTTPGNTFPQSSRAASTLPSAGSRRMRLRARSTEPTHTRATRPGLKSSSARRLRRCNSMTGRKPVIWLKKRKKTPLSRNSFTTPITSSPKWTEAKSQTTGASSFSSERLLVHTSVCWCGSTLTTRTRSFFPTGKALRGSFTEASSLICSGYNTPRIYDAQDTTSHTWVPMESVTLCSPAAVTVAVTNCPGTALSTATSSLARMEAAVPASTRSSITS